MINYWKIELEGATIETTDSETSLEFAMERLDQKIKKADAQITFHNLPFIVAEPEQLTRLFTLLLENALDYSEVKPLKIHLEAQNIDDVTIDIPEPKIEHGWLFSVKDNGIGIQKDALDHIFKIFQKDLTDSEDHLGMGLANAWRIVKRHGGNIWIDTEQGKGTTVYFTLPEYDSPDNKA
ncbi:MAG: hypothetical protein OMM_01926 [Candidatus Magnetoglobus multicellularis str. Araruama]|uniref:histidine kinase n=1 Tax=Candidatus Magnetoglobus multicellularis str. Araruama TaxID=890399 RepID=A0A1V1PBL3_9BACT|nr:MAG: hypothetical protein OMM_01926 [Candidatus Magnetoglobus multicellularis str. Araruama]